MHTLKIFALLVVSASLVSSSASWAAPPAGGVTEAPVKELTKGLLRDELYSLKPLAGLTVFKDSRGDTTSRGALGLSLDMNLTPFIDQNYKEWFVGPATGVLFSHLGDPSSNFFGADATNPAAQGSANLLIVPTNLKVGYAFTDYYRISIHGGGNIVYRSVASSLNLGSGSTGSSDLWKYYPNVGADLDVAAGKNVALTLRPDWTVTPEDTIFSASLGIGIFFLG